MSHSDCIFWNVDTQIDFVMPEGKLYVPGAELLKSNWKRLTNFAKSKSIKVVNTADWHNPDSYELSATPDYIKTFPQHCMANTIGAEYIEETIPESPLIINWEGEKIFTRENIDFQKYRNFVIRKDVFDVFKGNPFTEELLNLLSPETVVVYGVTTNVCVNDAVLGLTKRVKRVFVIEDAIKELPNIPLPFDNWKKYGVQLIKLHEMVAVVQN